MPPEWSHWPSGCRCLVNNPSSRALSPVCSARPPPWDGGGKGKHHGACRRVRLRIAHRPCRKRPDWKWAASKSIRLVAAVDCGETINRGLVAQQIEAGLIWALAQATITSTSWVAGMPRARRLARSGCPRLGETVEIMVQLLPSNDPPGGVSGLGTAALAPALANATLCNGSGKSCGRYPLILTAFHDEGGRSSRDAGRQDRLCSYQSWNCPMRPKNAQYGDISPNF